MMSQEHNEQQNIQQHIDEQVLTISLCRHAKKNALTTTMYADLAAAISNAASNDAIRSIIITGNQDFSAGNDLADFLESPPTDTDAPVVTFMNALKDCPLPVVAAVDGVAIGIGTTMLLHCDLIYCTPNTRFCLPFINLGVVPEYASSLLLPRLAGHNRAAELLMLGEPFDANLALDIGVVNAIVEPEKLQEHAKKIAGKLAKKPRQAMYHTKSLIKSDNAIISDRIHTEMAVFARLLKSEETVDRLKSFFEKK